MSKEKKKNKVLCSGCKWSGDKYDLLEYKDPYLDIVYFHCPGCGIQVEV